MSFGVSHTIVWLDWQRIHHLQRWPWLSRECCLLGLQLPDTFTELFMSWVSDAKLFLTRMKTQAVCFLFDAGVNLGSKLAPSMQQAGRRGQGGAYEVVRVSFLNGALWDPMGNIHSKVSCFVFLKIMLTAFIFFCSSFVFVLMLTFFVQSEIL